MDRSTQRSEQLDALATHLAARRGALLQAWHEAVQADPELTSADALPRRQFNDHIPGLLDALARKLRPRRQLAANDAQGLRDAAADAQNQQDAAGHGLQRWQQGYQLREVTREWAHLQMCLAAELEAYAEAHPELSPGTMSGAWRAVAELCSHGITESTSQYFALQQAEAIGHVRDMQETLQEAQELDRRRNEMFRQAAHDLRGNVGVVKTVATGLASERAPEAMREQFMRLLQKNVDSLQTMLNGVLDLARLQAGQELRDIQPLNASLLLGEIAHNLQPMAHEKGLELRHAGPPSLGVEGDAMKIRRIVQNLLLNAIKYTGSGSVTLGWGDSRDNDPKRWMLWVQDTGPGFHAGPGAPIVEALKEATTGSRHVDPAAAPHDPQDHGSDTGTVASAAAADARPLRQEHGEGIGLSIVKRLCELLDASMELDSETGVGTTIRVMLPRGYAAP